MADRWFEVELSLRGYIRVKLDGTLHDDRLAKTTSTRRPADGEN